MRKLIFVFILLFCLPTLLFAQSEELPSAKQLPRIGDNSLAGFTQIARSKYFNIYSQKTTNLLSLTKQLNIHSEYLLLNGGSFEAQGQLQTQFGAIIDAIFLEACDMLHMYLYEFRGNIRICQSPQDIEKLLALSAASKEGIARSCYLHTNNSIYISMQDMRPEVLGYEIASAIIAHYYIVLPPVEVRELLAKDVGNRIRKMAQ